MISKLHSFPIFLIFKSQTDSNNGCEGGSVARSGWQGGGWQGGGAVGDIRVKIKLTTFCLHLSSIKFKLMFMLTFVNFQLMAWKT